MTAQVATPTQTATRSTWKIDPSHTLIEFAARHMMVSTVKGQFTKFDGTLLIDEANPANSSAEITIEADSLTTRDERRDGHLGSPDFLDVANYPTITFKSRRIVLTSSDKFQVVGDLTIRGVTREITLNATYEGQQKSPWGSTVAGFTAQAAFDRRDYNLTWNAALETGGVLVGDQVKISLEVEAIRQ